MNKIITKLPTQTSESNPYDKYGSGAESKLRLEEAINKMSNTPYYAVPVSEGRMRAHEQRRIVTTDTRTPEYDRRHSKPAQESEKIKPTVTSLKPIPKNPFDEEDDQYDETKNPFAHDDDESLKTEVTNETSNKTEYDNNLNPFE